MLGGVDMSKKLIRYYYIGIIIYFFSYYIMAFFDFEVVKEIILSSGIFFTFVVIFYTHKKTTGINSITWFVLSLAVLIWTFSDIYWDVCQFILRLDPQSMDIFNILYLIPTILFMFAQLIYMKRFVSGMNAVQLIIDIIAVSLICLIMFWFIVLKSDISIFIKDLKNIILFTYIICDFVIINLVIICLMSIRKGKINKSNYVKFLGVQLYAAIDLVYCYVYFYNLYVPDTITDTIYALSFIIIALGGLYSLSYKEANTINSLDFSIENIGSKGKEVFLLSPILFYTILRGFSFKITTTFLLIFLIYKVISNYVQNAINNEKLLKKEMNMNVLLEEKVNERTKELMLKNKELEYLSFHDSITSAYNVRFLKNYLDKIICENNEQNEIVLFYIDIDRFKTINDIYGHDIGDRLLIEISNRLINLCSNKGIVARTGGDEFVLTCRHNLESEEIKSIANKIIDICSELIVIENYQFNMGVSIGIAVFPKDAESRVALFKNADMAMCDAKIKGGNKYSLFNSHMSDMILEKHEIEVLLKNADYNTEFNLVYQPQIDIVANKLVGMEALIRWNSPIKGNIPPSKFIKIAEEIGCIERISEFVMNTAACQIGAWNKKYNCNLKMGINVSPNQLDSIKFAEKLSEIIKKYNLDNSWIDIEITENIAMKGETTLEEIFSMLDNMGISTSIDDFGTGYSSLSYIQQFSFDRIKIAKELVDDITTDLSRKHIVKAIITMAEALNVVTIAEGIETSEQLEIVKELGCNQIQGYFYSRPIKAEEFERKYLTDSKYASSNI